MCGSGMKAMMIGADALIAKNQKSFSLVAWKV